jgi:hypothetical protein
MCTSQAGCSKDYSLLTAKTGIATISTANSNLDGSGTTATVVTAGLLGATVKSVIIKATGPVTSGMVRLFIHKVNPGITVLYKEVQIPVTPVLTSTPTPMPVLPVYEVTLMGDLKLQAGDSLKVSTQIGDSFNVIAETLDWEYPSTLPTDCCNYKQVIAVTGLALVATANPNLDGSGTISTAFTAPASSSSNGSLVKTITIKAQGSTSINGMIRLFISDDGGTTWYLMREVQVPQTTQSAYEPSYKQVIDMNYHLNTDYLLGVSTQNGESFGITVEGESWSYPI